MTDLDEVFDSADDWWKDSAERALQWWAQTGQPFDAFDITELGVPDPDHPARWGALFNAALSRGVIVHAGWHRSRRPSRAGGVCSVWIGTEKAQESAA